jgi:hypothetical protein
VLTYTYSPWCDVGTTSYVCVRYPGEAGANPALTRNREPPSVIYLGSKSEHLADASGSSRRGLRGGVRTQSFGSLRAYRLQVAIERYFMFRRFRNHAVIMAVLVGCVTLSVSSTSAVATPSAPARSDTGLFGATDPTYDGVLRQSYALIGLTAVGTTPPPAAVDWLVQQQCASGAFMAYRTDSCTAADLTTYTGTDSNSTAAAAIALLAVGQLKPGRAAVRWLVDSQRPDGGWPWLAGLASDPVSTGLVMQALRIEDRDSKPLRTAIRRGAAWIRAQVADCSPSRENFGGLGFSAQSVPDGFSTATALIGFAGPLTAVSPTQAQAAPSVQCSGDVGAAGAMSRFLVSSLARNGGSIPGLMDASQPDWNATAFAIIALRNAGYGASAMQSATRLLLRNVDDYVLTGDDTMPAAIGTLLLVARATGSAPRAFGPQRINLVSQLLATQRV